MGLISWDCPFNPGNQNKLDPIINSMDSITRERIIVSVFSVSSMKAFLELKKNSNLKMLYLIYPAEFDVVKLKRLESLLTSRHVPPAVQIRHEHVHIPVPAH